MQGKLYKEKATGVVFFQPDGWHTRCIVLEIPDAVGQHVPWNVGLHYNFPITKDYEQLQLPAEQLAVDQIEWVGSYDYRTLLVDCADGRVPITSLTIRSLRKMLEDQNPDNVVILMDCDEEGKSRGFVPVSGMAGSGPMPMTILLSQASVEAVKEQAKKATETNEG